MKLRVMCGKTMAVALSLALMLECAPAIALAEDAETTSSEDAIVEVDETASEDVVSDDVASEQPADGKNATDEPAEATVGTDALATTEEAAPAEATVPEDESAVVVEAVENEVAASAETHEEALPTEDPTTEAVTAANEPELTAQGSSYSIAKATITYQQTWTYTGKPIKPKVTVKYNGTTLKEGTHYQVGYEANTNPGTGYIFVESIEGEFEYQICYFNIIREGTWKKLPGGWRYYYTKSSYYTSQIQMVDGAYYGFDSKGYMATGWRRSEKLLGYGEKWLYFDGSGKMGIRWQKIGGSWYYFAPKQKLDLPRGSMYTGLHNISGKYYYFSSSGAMVTGWKKLSGTWYYFGSDGAAKTGWQKIGGSWYWFNAKGKMATGRKTIDGKSYYFGSNGAMRTGWQKISGKYYYFYSSGAMAKSTWVGTYHVNAKGVWDRSK